VQGLRIEGQFAGQVIAQGMPVPRGEHCAGHGSAEARTDFRGGQYAVRVVRRASQSLCRSVHSAEQRVGQGVRSSVQFSVRVVFRTGQCAELGSEHGRSLRRSEQCAVHGLALGKAVCRAGQ
jgi:hypothetical protein